MAVEYHCCGAAFFEHIVIIVVLVLFAGLMSGLTLGLMSLSLVDLEVLAKSGTEQDRKHAAKILPVVKNQHLLLCTLLICNAAAMEALPIFLDSLVTAWGAILISVTLILLFGEILPQSICSRYGLAIGASVAPLVRVLLLDQVLGKGHTALFRRAELKTLVTLHGNEAGKGGELTHDETTIIAGALELTEKKAKDAMTSLCQTFAIDINAKLDRDLMQKVLDKGHSRVPVYYEKKTNIIGLILVKNLLSINPDDEIPIKRVTIRKIPRVLEDMPLYDILNEFQKGHSHMAVVIRQTNPSYAAEPPANDGGTLGELQGSFPWYLACGIYNNFLSYHFSLFSFFLTMWNKEVAIAIDDKHGEKVVKNLPPLRRWKSYPNSQNSNRGNRSRKWSKDQSDVLQIHEEPLPTLNEDEEAVGIITMEDVIEELLQEEIYDETDVHVEEQ
uniref:CNNM transmembrane domain-containing protein n=1 Tax=Leersia perrieri TaxID=77586 RepID=A0A0D9VXB7_9ORYZ